MRPVGPMGHALRFDTLRSLGQVTFATVEMVKCYFPSMRITLYEDIQRIALLLVML